MSNNSPEEYDLTPEWFGDYNAMLDIVYPQREETLIFKLEDSDEEA